MNMLRIFLFGVVLVVAAKSLQSSQQPGQIPGSVEAGNAIGRIQNPRDSQGQSNTDAVTPSPTQQALRENVNAIKTDVARLYELASDLKSEVDKTDITKILPASLSKKAQQIEKLAKEIKSRSKS
jgi:hypothetical protein